MKLHVAIAQSKYKMAYRTEDVDGRERCIGCILSRGPGMLFTMHRDGWNLAQGDDFEREDWLPYPTSVVRDKWSRPGVSGGLDRKRNGARRMASMTAKERHELAMKGEAAAAVWRKNNPKILSNMRRRAGQILQMEKTPKQRSDFAKKAQNRKVTSRMLRKRKEREEGKV